MDKIIAYDWEEMIRRIIEGIQNFIAKVKQYMPKSAANYEDPAYLKDYEAE